MDNKFKSIFGEMTEVKKQAIEDAKSNVDQKRKLIDTL